MRKPYLQTHKRVGLGKDDFLKKEHVNENNYMGDSEHRENLAIMN